MSFKVKLGSPVSPHYIDQLPKPEQTSCLCCARACFRISQIFTGVFNRYAVQRLKEWDIELSARSESSVESEEEEELLDAEDTPFQQLKKWDIKLSVCSESEEDDELLDAENTPLKSSQNNLSYGTSEPAPLHRSISQIAFRKTATDISELHKGTVSCKQA